MLKVRRGTRQHKIRERVRDWRRKEQEDTWNKIANIAGKRGRGESDDRGRDRKERGQIDKEVEALQGNSSAKGAAGIQMFT